MTQYNIQMNNCLHFFFLSLLVLLLLPILMNINHSNQFFQEEERRRRRSHRVVYSGTHFYQRPIYNSVSNTPATLFLILFFILLLQQYFPSPFHFGKRERSWPSIPRATLGLTSTIDHVMAYCMWPFTEKENAVLSSALCLTCLLCCVPLEEWIENSFFFKGKVRIGSANKQRADTRPYPFPVRYIRLGRPSLISYRLDDDRSDFWRIQYFQF